MNWKVMIQVIGVLCHAGGRPATTKAVTAQLMKKSDTLTEQQWTEKAREYSSKLDVLYNKLKKLRNQNTKKYVYFYQQAEAIAGQAKNLYDTINADIKKRSWFHKRLPSDVLYYADSTIRSAIGFFEEEKKREKFDIEHTEVMRILPG